jgi:hypothetical protein
MRTRWLLNLALLLLVAGIAVFLYLRPQPQEVGPTKYPLSTVRPEAISLISVELPAKAPVLLEKRDGHWYMAQPLQARVNAAFASQVLKLLYANSTDKFADDDLVRFGLDQPRLKLKLGSEVFSFGTFNPVSGQQYVAYNGAVYLVDTQYSELASTQVLEMLDKNLLGPLEQIVGFDFSHLEQWEQSGLVLDRDGDSWKVSAAAAKPDQQELRQWFAEYWANPTAVTVEPYKPDHRTQHPSFKVKLQGGKVVHFDKLQESPEMLLGRPDEGLLYHLRPDMGFVLLNPPVGFKNN